MSVREEIERREREERRTRLCDEVRIALDWSRLRDAVAEEDLTVPCTGGHVFAGGLGAMCWPADGPLIRGSREERSARLEELREEIAAMAPHWWAELACRPSVALESMAELLGEAWALLARGVAEGRGDNIAAAVMLPRRVVRALYRAASPVMLDEEAFGESLNAFSDALQIVGDRYGMNQSVGDAWLADVAAGLHLGAEPVEVSA